MGVLKSSSSSTSACVVIGSPCCGAEDESGAALDHIECLVVLRMHVAPGGKTRRAAFLAHFVGAAGVTGRHLDEHVVGPFVKIAAIRPDNLALFHQSAPKILDPPLAHGS